MRIVAAALALSVATVSAGLLVRVGQLEPATDQAVLDALRQSPGLTTYGRQASKAGDFGAFISGSFSGMTPE